MSEVLPTLCEKLSQYAIEQPNKLAWAFYDDKLNEIERYTYAELESATDALASYLLDDCRLKSGDRVILVFLPCVAFSVALVGCFKAGVVGVPVFPPGNFFLFPLSNSFTDYNDCILYDRSLKAWQRSASLFNDSERL